MLLFAEQQVILIQFFALPIRLPLCNCLHVWIIILYNPSFCELQRFLFISVDPSSFLRNIHRINDNPLIAHNFCDHLGRLHNIFKNHDHPAHICYLSHYYKLPVVAIHHAIILTCHYMNHILQLSSVHGHDGLHAWVKKTVAYHHRHVRNDVFFLLFLLDLFLDDGLLLHDLLGVLLFDNLL